MRKLRGFRPIACLPAAVALPLILFGAGCGVTDAPEQDAHVDESTLAFTSDTASLSPTAVFGASPAYVSLSPGTFPGVTTALIRNERSGEQFEVPLKDGGLDPIPVTALVGDRLQLMVAAGSGRGRTFTSVVPARRRPRVVRINPPRGRADVALTASVVIVFSEPVDPATVTSTTITLESEAGVTISGAVDVAIDGLSAIFVPRSNLAANTMYRLAVTADVRDRDGSPIEIARETTFRTRGVPVGPAPLPLELTANVIAFRNFFGGIMLMSPDGSSSVSVFGTTSSDADPAWSPDGTKLVVTRGELRYETELFVLQPRGPGGAVSLQQRGSDASWSPDGSRIAFVSRRTGASRIYVMNADGSGLSRLTDGAGEDLSPAWSPDGSRIAFVRTGQPGHDGTLHVMNADGSGVTSLEQEGTSPAWSPDGSRIAFAKLIRDPWRQDIYVMNVDGTGVVQLTLNSTPAMSNGPTWSPDGTRIAFAHTPDPDSYPDQIYVMSADGTGIQHIGPDRQGQGLVSASYAPAWSPR